MGLIFQAFLFAQPYQPVNIVVEDHPEDQHEVAIAIDPVDPLHLMTTWNDFRTAGNVGFHPGYGFSSGDPFSWSTSILQNIDDIWDGGFDPSCT
ncbi:MAG: hypothetical protein GWO08_19545, partial [Gammaproteobacteria bacterium]|nr:hypothetical protein [Gammaproteobacteria bacterium]NIW50375.1 hypothetical protein [Gammaproteobacteria bacterium]NIX59755.1 hypothetical protein [candidate division Zixibacteria bacterium]